MKRVQIIIFGILALMIVCSIFSNSAQPRSVSAGRSSTLMDVLKPLLDPHDRIDADVFHHYLRKAAHFTEFAALGFSVMGLTDCVSWRRKRRRFLTPLLASLLVAAADEAIQLFAPLRGPGLGDVLLDFCGAAFGVACMALLTLLLRRIKKTAPY